MLLRTLYAATSLVPHYSACFSSASSSKMGTGREKQKRKKKKPTRHIHPFAWVLGRPDIHFAFHTIASENRKKAFFEESCMSFAAQLSALRLRVSLVRCGKQSGREDVMGRRNDNGGEKAISWTETVVNGQMHGYIHRHYVFERHSFLKSTNCLH